MLCMQAGEEQYIAAGFLHQPQYSSSVKLITEYTSMISSSLLATMTPLSMMPSMPPPKTPPVIGQELRFIVPIGAVGGGLVFILAVVIAIAVW